MNRRKSAPQGGEVQHAIITHVVNSRRTSILINADNIRDLIISRVKGTNRDLTVISRVSTKIESLAVPGITYLISINRIIREIRKIIRSQKSAIVVVAEKMISSARMSAT